MIGKIRHKFELRQVFDFSRPSLSLLCDTFEHYDLAHAQAQLLLKNYGGQYFIKNVRTQIVYCSKRRKEPK